MTKDTELHFRELLITLDYLLNYATEDCPATQLAICRYAKEYGLHFEDKGFADEIRRDRIGKCLEYLDHVSLKFGDKVPFVVSVTDGGKYYISEKNHLNKEQIFKILEAIKIDKYIKEEDSDELIERLLDALANKKDRASYLEKLEKESKKVRKYNALVNKKIKLITKAFDQKKSILVLNDRIGHTDEEPMPDTFHSVKANRRTFLGSRNKKVYCRVYRIEEHNGKPYAILIPLSQSGYIFDAIENLNIPTDLPERTLLMEDETSDDRLEELFRTNNERIVDSFGSFGSFMEKQVMSCGSGIPYKVSFYFEYKYLERIKASFEEFFAIEMPVTKCNRFKIDNDISKRRGVINSERAKGGFAIECDPLSENETPLYGVVNILINGKAFKAWLYNNPNIAEVVDVVSPWHINVGLSLLHFKMYEKYKESFEKASIS